MKFIVFVLTSVSVLMLLQALHVKDHLVFWVVGVLIGFLTAKIEEML